MTGVIKVCLFFIVVTICCATEQKRNKDEKVGAKLQMKRVKEDDDAKVEVLDEGKSEETKAPKKDEEDHDKEEDEDEEEDEEEEEEDPNAQISIDDLYVPKVCENKTRSGDLVVVHYTGWLDDNEHEIFDTTIDAVKGYVPFEFLLGTGTVIKGFEKGVVGMCKGQKRKLVIPPALGYGKKGAGDVPG